MFLIIAKHGVRVDKINDFINSIEPLIKETNQNHEGCIRYELFQDLDNPCSLTMIEVWENQIALDKHKETNTFKDTLPVLEKCLIKPVQINKYHRID